MDYGSTTLKKMGWIPKSGWEANNHMLRAEERPIIVVDDDPVALMTSSMQLSENGFRVFACNNAAEAAEKVKGDSVAAVLTDVRMPEVSGLEFLEVVHAVNPGIPVILITAHADIAVAVEAFHRGAFDFIIKPASPAELAKAVKRAVEHRNLTLSEKDYTHTLEESVRQKTRELADALKMLGNASREIIERLAGVAEYRDTDTGRHIKRIGLFSKVLAEAMGMPKDFVEAITFASILHDIGKVGIPDGILLKPDSLTPAEFEIIRTHTTIGVRMLANSSYPGMPMAASIALTHHETWDGDGYPRGLKKTDIPIEGRIVMLVDQYDALRSKRPYKPPFSHAKALQILTEGDDRTKPEYFDPDVLRGFLRVGREFERLFEIHSDDEL